MTTTNTNVWSCSKHRSAHHAVFVSYRQNGSDSLLAELFCAEMEADLTKRYHPASLPVFLDKRCLPIGGDWSEGFINGLQKSRVIVYLLSKESIRTMLSKLEKGQRDNVLVEIEEGLQLKSIADRATTLIPVLIGNYHHSHANQMEKLVPFAEFDESTLEHSKSGLKVKETMANLFKFQGLHLDPKNVAASVNVIIEELGRIEVPQSFCSWATPTQTQTALGSQHQLHSRPNPTIYINRDDILSQIDTTLRSNASTSSTAVLKGVGGSGKTFIATKYGYQCVDRGYQVAWLKADSEEAVKESYIAFAQWILRDYTISQLACFTLSNVMTMVESTSAKYPTTKKLMIFDNIEDYQHIQEIIRAHPNAQFLLTTRNPLYRDGLLMPFIKVDLPDSSRAEQFVVQSIPTLDLVHATTIVQQCEQLPLRLEITVKYLQQIFNNVNNYSVRKRKAGPEVAITATAVIAGKANKEHSQESIDYQKPIDYSKFVTKIINDYTSDVQNAKVACNEDSHPEIVVSLNYLMDQNKNAFEMFQLCAYLDPDAVSLDIIVDFQKRQSAQFWAPILHNFSKKVQKNLSESVPLLKELGLVKELGTVSNSVIVCIHRCVQAQLKASIKDENSKSMLAKEFYAQKMSQVRHAAMQYELGIQNFMKARLAERDGTPGTVSYQSALQYFQKAADIGHTQSCLALYIIFEFGFGVGVDKAISSHWCSKAGLSKAEVNCVKFDGKSLELLGKKTSKLNSLVNFSARVFDKVDSSADSSEWTYVSSALSQGSIIRNLDLRGISVGISGAKVIAKYLDDTSTLQCLYMELKNIGDEGARMLATALRRNSTLQFLTLSNNYFIGIEGGRALANALAHNTTLKHFNLLNSNIADKGACALAAALDQNCTLQHLNLWKNNIGDVGAIALATALERNSMLQYLNLESNNIGIEGRQTIEWLRQKRPLLDVVL